MQFLLTTWEGGGTVAPMAELARRLTARGHAVRMMSDDCNRAEAEDAGAAFAGWRRAPNRRDRSRETQRFHDWAAPTPQDGLLSVVRDIWCGPALSYAQDVVEALREEPADLVVTNEALFGAMAACESLGQRFVVLSPNISLSPLPGIPPLGPGFLPARNAEERALHGHVAVAVQAMFDSGLPALNETRAALGLRPIDHVLDQFDAADTHFLATAQSFDFPAECVPERMRYVGPLLGEPYWARDWTSPWLPSDDRPLVVVSFSTTFQNHAGALQKVMDALSALPVRVLVTLGGSIGAGEVSPAANCALVDGAPHGIVMRDAALVVTHGGHGTVMRALIGRSPMLIVPHGRDQNDNAARVTARGAGLSLAPDASVEDIRAACGRLLSEPEFRAAARDLGDRVALEAGASTLVDALEAPQPVRQAA